MVDCYTGAEVTEAAMAEQRRGYLAYLLRLWQASGDGKTAWRASFENAHTGERKGFTNLDDLFDFLRQQVELSTDLEMGSTVVTTPRPPPYGKEAE